jgi:hypothetical protein
LVSIGNDEVEQSVGLSGTRALVPVAPMSAESDFTSPARADVRPNAPFLTQLIATADGHPQTRARRRADPNRATTAYAAMMQPPAAAGRAVHESR